MRDDRRASVELKKAASESFRDALSPKTKSVLKSVSAMVLAVMFGIFLLIVFPVAGSGSSIMEEGTVPGQAVQRHGRKAYAHGDVSLISNVNDLPVISDIYDEYDLKVIHSPSAEQMKSVQGGAWKIVWIAAALFMLYVYKVCLQRGKLYAFRRPCFSCELLILLKKDGKKR